MKKVWKKTSIALLVAGLTVSGTGYVLANEKVKEPIDLSQLGKVEDKITKTDDVKKLPEIPKGYHAGNLAALAKVYEKVENPTAKAAILRNMERAIAKWEAKQQELNKATQPTVKKPIDKDPIVGIPTPVVPSDKNESKQNLETKKAEYEAKKAEYDKLKAEYEKLKAEQKSNEEKAKHEKKELKKENKTERKNEKEKHKSEHKASKENEKSKHKGSKKHDKSKHKHGNGHQKSKNNGKNNKQ